MIALVFLATYVGAAKLSFQKIGQALLAKTLPFLDIESYKFAVTVVWDLRLPRIIMAIIAGFGLGISGATMQGILRNPLVSPFTLGLSSAAGFGAALAIVIGWGLVKGGTFFIIINAFVFAVLAMILVFFVSRLRSLNPETLVLAGIAIMYLFSSMTSFLQYISDSDQLSGIVFWMMGSLATSTWLKVAISLAILLFSITFLIKFSWEINAMVAGDEMAATLGTNVKAVRILCMSFSTLIVAAIISFTGVIGFIGLVAPHITRMIIGNDYRYLLPLSGLTGAILLLASDILARTVFQPSELPLSVMTSFIGVPFFVYILLTRRRNYF
ncbi:MAG: FecCD family ABC transporter permease [Candidatus Humimicrobiaceae bacterium]